MSGLNIQASQQPPVNFRFRAAGWHRRRFRAAGMSSRSRLVDALQPSRTGPLMPFPSLLYAQPSMRRTCSRHRPKGRRRHRTLFRTGRMLACRFLSVIQKDDDRGFSRLRKKDRGPPWVKLIPNNNVAFARRQHLIGPVAAGERVAARTRKLRWLCVCCGNRDAARVFRERP